MKHLRFSLLISSICILSSSYASEQASSSAANTVVLNTHSARSYVKQLEKSGAMQTITITKKELQAEAFRRITEEVCGDIMRVKQAYEHKAPGTVFSSRVDLTGITRKPLHIQYKGIVGGYIRAIVKLNILKRLEFLIAANGNVFKVFHNGLFSHSEHLTTLPSQTHESSSSETRAVIQESSVVTVPEAVSTGTCTHHPSELLNENNAQHEPQPSLVSADDTTDVIDTGAQEQ